MCHGTLRLESALHNVEMFWNSFIISMAFYHHIFSAFDAVWGEAPSRVSVIRSSHMSRLGRVDKTCKSLGSFFLGFVQGTSTICSKNNVARSYGFQRIRNRPRKDTICSAIGLSAHWKFVPDQGFLGHFLAIQFLSCLLQFLPYFGVV